MHKLVFTIKPELDRIRQTIRNEEDKITCQASADGVLYSNIPELKKGQAIPKLLDSEVMRVAKEFPLSGKNVSELRDFILEVSNRLTAGNKYIDSKYVEPSIAATSQKVVNQFLADKKQRRSDGVKYLLNTSIAVAALVVSIIAAIAGKAP